ncbi:hypothetical protein FALBO_13290 [Fusarium albosuccineum]|uniref:Uncharacterized protein n=1 Tax=Fusarium albosuccineum TaxID=1237068 RepID=A0A8H4P2C9_9HYPO|nr:hypothetical protein FALBO_13290 [Fusarium albosuccineum]
MVSPDNESETQTEPVLNVAEHKRQDDIILPTAKAPNQEITEVVHPEPVADEESGPQENARRVTMAFYLSSWPLVLHFFMSLAVFLVLTQFVDQFMVDDSLSGTSWKTAFEHHQLRVSDITTIVSTGVKIQQLLASAWALDATWRCTFLLLRNQGLSINSFKKMISFKLPTTFNGPGSLVPMVVLLLMLPTALISPVITGAVDWNTSSRYAPAEKLPLAIGNRTPANWTAYLKTARAEKWALRSQGRLNELWQGNQWTEGDWKNGQQHRVLAPKLITPRTNPIPPGSRVKGALLPHLKVHKIEWDQLPWSKDITDLRDSEERRYNLNLAEGRARWHDYANHGKVLIYNQDVWNSSDKFCSPAAEDCRLPTPEVFRGTIKALVLFKILQNADSCLLLSPTTFGNISSVARFDRLSKSFEYTLKDRKCYISATLHITAGMIKPDRAEYATSQHIEAKGEYRGKIMPSLWSREALYRLPDLSIATTITNVSHIPTWDNLEGYVKIVTTMAYSASWGQLSNFYQSPESSDLEVEERIGAQQAQVDKVRALIWLGFNLLFTLSGIFLMAYQVFVGNPMVIEGPVEALLTPISPELAEMPREGLEAKGAKLKLSSTGDCRYELMQIS